MSGRRSGGEVQGTGLITKAWNILDAVGEAPGRLGVAELTQATGLPKSTLYRIVSALVARGLLRSDARGQTYLLGYHFLDLANKVWSVPDLLSLASAELRRLREMTGETAYLAALTGEDAVAIARNVGAHENSSMSALGSVKPLYCTSQGKAILAHLPAKQAEQLIANIRFAPLTEHTITDAERLRRHLEIVRQRGFSVDDQEIYPDTRCVGAPVFDFEGSCVGSISITGPAYRMSLERIEQLGPELIEAAKRIRSNLPPPQTFDESRTHGCRPIGETAFYGVSPCWAASERRLYWADRLAPAVYALEGGGEPRLLARLPQPIDAIALAGEGGVIAISGGRRRRIDPKGVCTEWDGPPRPKLAVLRSGADGALWGAAVSDGRSEIGRLTVDGVFEVRWTASAEIGDLAVADDGGRLYGVDGKRGLVYEFSHARAAPHIFARIGRASGEPHAAALDPEGRLWLALWDGWAAARLDETGEIDRILALPVPRPTGLAFAGPERAQLYVTSARLGLSRDVLENAPASGRLHVFASWR